MTHKKRITKEEAKKTMEKIFECLFAPCKISEEEKEDFKNRYSAHCWKLIKERYDIVDE